MSTFRQFLLIFRRKASWIKFERIGIVIGVVVSVDGGSRDGFPLQDEERGKIRARREKRVKKKKNKKKKENVNNENQNLFNCQSINCHVLLKDSH